MKEVILTVNDVVYQELVEVAKREDRVGDWVYAVVVCRLADRRELQKALSRQHQKVENLRRSRASAVMKVKEAEAEEERLIAEIDVIERGNVVESE